MPNNSYLRPLRVRDLAKSRAQVLIHLIFISAVTAKVRFEVRVRVRFSCRVRVTFNNYHMSANLILRVIWQCDIFGMTPVHIIMI